MTTWIGYFYIESLGLTDAQRKTLVDVLKAWGVANDSPYPNLRNHWAVRPDGLAVIFEGALDADKLTPTWFKTKLAEIFSVAESSITYATTSTAYGPTVLFKYNTVNKLRLGIFGGLTATWAESWAAVLAFLAAYKDVWEVQLP